MFRKFNFQRPTTGDPITDFNWQTLIDNTKGGTYTPTVGTINAGSGSISVQGWYEIDGPTVFVLVSLEGFNNVGIPANTIIPGATPTLSLPTPVCVPTIYQFLPI